MLNVCVKVADKRVDNVMAIANTMLGLLIRLKNDEKDYPNIDRSTSKSTKKMARSQTNSQMSNLI